MRNVKLLLIVMLSFFCMNVAYAEEEMPKVFYFDWENGYAEYFDDGELTLSDNFAFKDGAVIIRTLRDVNSYDPYIELELRDVEGEIIAENTIKNAYFFSGITDNNYIYIVVRKAANEKGVAGNSDQFVLKIDDKLEVVASLEFVSQYTPGVDGMINARNFGHDILAIAEDKLYVFCGEDYMLNTSLDLEEWEVTEFLDEDFTKYFPDLATEYYFLSVWMNDFSDDTKNKVDILVTTHVYSESILSSGARYFKPVPQPISADDDIDAQVSDESSFPMIGLIKIMNKQGETTFEVTNENYAKFLEARMIGDYIVAIGLTESSVLGNNNSSQLGNDIVIYNMDGEVVQIIETDGSYLYINETTSGFVTTHFELCKEAPNALELAGSNSPSICGYNTEAYYLPLNIETKVNGNGNVRVMKMSRRGANVTFEITPEPGYVLDSVKVTDANGRVLMFRNYTFTMPSADVTIEANFLPKNPKTYDGILNSVKLALISGAGIVGLSLLVKKKKRN